MPDNDSRQVTGSEYKDMTPEQRVRARNEGRLAVLLGGVAPVDVSGDRQFTEADVRRMTPEQVVQARKDGRVADYAATPNLRNRNSQNA